MLQVVLLASYVKLLLPISEECYFSDLNSSIDVYNLSTNLRKNFANSEIPNNISIARRLLSENKGINSIIEHVNKNQKLKLS